MTAPDCCPGDIAVGGHPFGMHTQDCPVYLANCEAWERARAEATAPEPCPVCTPGGRMPTAAEVLDHRPDCGQAQGLPQQAEWQPGDPVYPAEGAYHGSCGPCLTRWTAPVDRCPECGELSTEALRAALGPSDGENVPAPLSDLDARQVAAVPALLAMCDDAEQSMVGSTPHLTTREVRAAVAAAVPGEDVPARPASWRGSFVDLVGVLAVANAVTAPDGEDVPARLDAVAEALALWPAWATCADWFRMAADELREDAPPEVRSAVAAALARPPQGCTPTNGAAQ